MKHILLATILAGASFLGVQAASPKAEIRAVWLTGSNLDWPSASARSNSVTQKKELTAILDKLQAANFNTVIFQAQVKGDVAWKSSYQPAMFYLTGNGAKELSYDVAKYVIDECHKRDMECHAWIVPYRIGTASEANRYQSNAKHHPYHEHPEWCRLYNGAYYLDPGLPQVREYLVNVYRELVADYDFDGLSFDYTRYPAADGFPDDDTYANYNPQGMNRAEWRRDNINTFMAEVHDMAKSIKPNLKVGSAPIGTYQNLPGYGNMTAYGVYQDPVQWMTSGHHDLIVPQLYYNEKYGFEANMKSWGSWIEGGMMAIGLAPYKMNDGVNDWEPSVIFDQIEKIRKCSTASGVCFFRTEHVIGDGSTTYQDLYNELVDNYFKYPAHIPSISTLSMEKPSAPTSVTQVYNNGKYIIQWDEPNEADNVRYNTVYLLSGSRLVLSDPKLVAAHKVHGTSLEYVSTDADLKFAVSSFNANYCESDAVTATILSGIEGVSYPQSTVTYGDNTLRVSGNRPVDRVEIYSLTGTLVKSQQICGNDAAIECGSLGRGLYVSRVLYCDGGADVCKILR